MSQSNPVTALAARVAAGEFTTLAWCSMADPAVPEHLVREGFDSAMLDMQHGASDMVSAMAGISAVTLAGKPCVVRIPVGHFSTASRLLDMGAAGVIAPMINSLADAKAFAGFMKLPPMGERSWGPSRALALTGMDMPTYLREANKFHLAIAMIETREAISALDDILAVPGIDGVFVGPSDLSIALSNGKAIDPNSKDVDAALDHICKRAKAHKKFASAFCFTGKKANELRLRGYAMCSVATDSILLRAAARAELAIARGA